MVMSREVASKAKHKMLRIWMSKYFLSGDFGGGFSPVSPLLRTPLKLTRVTHYQVHMTQMIFWRSWIQRSRSQTIFPRSALLQWRHTYRRLVNFYFSWSLSCVFAVFYLLPVNVSLLFDLSSLRNSKLSHVMGLHFAPIDLCRTVYEASLRTSDV